MGFLLSCGAIAAVTRATFISILVFVLGVRMLSLPLPGTEDVRVWKIWSYHASKDVTSMYGVGGTPPTRGVLKYRGNWTTVDYPPIALYEMAVAGWIHEFVDPLYDNTWRLNAAVKLPGLAAGMVLTWWLHALVRRLTGSDTSAQFGALAYWANPATILNAEVLGYLDPLVMLPALVALASASLARPTAGGAALGVALMTKPQALLIGPAFVAALGLSPRTVLRAALAGAAVIAIVLLPFALAGALPNMSLAVGSWYGRRDIVSGNAANLWWIVTWAERAYFMIPEFGFPGAYLEPVVRPLAISSFMEVGFPNPRPLGTLLVVATCGWGWWRLRGARDLVSHLLLGAFTIHAFFALGVGVHEHHMMLAVPILGLAAALEPHLRRLWIGISLVCALNMNLFYGISIGWGWAFPRRATLIDASVVLAIANLALLAWHARLVARRAGG